MNEIKAPVQFALTSSDRDSPTWTRLKKHLQARLEVLHREIAQDLSETQTAKLRGRIAQINEMLSLDKNPPPL